MLRVFDIRKSQPQRPVRDVQASPTEVLSCDWNKYDSGLIVTGGKDMGVRVWDLRGTTGKTVRELRGHTLAVREVQ